MRQVLLAATLLTGSTFLLQDSPTSKAPATAPASRPADAKDVATPEVIVAALYDVISGGAGQKRDWDRMRSLFHPEARLVPMLKRPDGIARCTSPWMTTSSVRGPMLEQGGFFEQEIARKADVFGDFAHVWSTYEGRKAKGDERPFLRGINSIQLVRQQGRWWVLQILWEQEHDAGAIPPQLTAGR